MDNKRPPIYNPDLIFDEAKHKYWLKSDPNIKFTSATTFIGKFFAPFNGPAIARNLVETNPKYKDYTVKSLLAEWNKSGTHGTHVHNQIENYILGDEECIVEKKAELAKDWINDTFDLSKHILYPEVRVASPKWKISGTIDLLAYNPDTDEYIIGDWKTNKKIDTTSYRGKKGIKKSTRHLDDCKYVKYALQMSLYRFILELEFGIAVKKQILIHLKPKELDLYFTPYYEKEIENMLKEFYEN